MGRIEDGHRSLTDPTIFANTGFDALVCERT